MTETDGPQFVWVALQTLSDEAWKSELIESLPHWEGDVAYRLADAKRLFDTTEHYIVLSYPSPHRHVGALLRRSDHADVALAQWVDFVSGLLAFHADHWHRVFLVEEDSLRYEFPRFHENLSQLVEGLPADSSWLTNSQDQRVLDHAEKLSAPLLLTEGPYSLHTALRASSVSGGEPLKMTDVVDELRASLEEDAGATVGQTDWEVLREENVLLIEQLHEAQSALHDSMALKDTYDRALRDKKDKLTDLSRKLKSARERVTELRKSLREERARAERLRKKSEDRGRRLRQLRDKESTASERVAELQAQLAAVHRTRVWKAYRYLRGGRG